MIEGKKTYLRGVIKELDLELFRNYRNNPELRRYFREHREITPDMQEEWWESVRKDPNQYNFTILSKPGIEIIGHCGLYYIDWIARKAEFGIYIGRESHRSCGRGSDALRTLIKYGFETLNLNKISCEVYSNNQSLHLYRRLGFKDEGVLRENYYDEGKYWDSHILSILRVEYDAAKKSSQDLRTFAGVV